MKVHRLSLGNNLKSSILLIFLLATFIGCNIYLYNNHQYYDLTVLLYSILLFFPMAVPAVFVHVEYLIYNWEATLTVDKINKKLTYEDEEKEIEADFDDIIKIIKHGVKSHALLYGFYKYFEIHLNSGEILIISILMTRDLSLPGIENEEKEHYFPSVVWDRFWNKEVDVEKNYKPSESLIKRFEKKYENYSQKSLVNIINSNNFRNEAQIAAKNLLENGKEKA